VADGVAGGGELPKHLSRMRDEDKVLLVFIAEKMAGQHPSVDH
jgi:hypothetical protein